MYYEIFSKEYLTESVYRDLSYSVDIQMDALRYQGCLPETFLHSTGEKRRERFVDVLLTRVLNSLDETMKHTPGRAEVIREVRKTYYHWNESAKGRIDAIAEQFPEFVSSMQQRLSERMLIHAEREAIEENERNWNTFT